MKVTRRILPPVIDTGMTEGQKIQDRRWFLEDVAAKLVRSWHNLNPEKLSEMLGNKEQAAYNAHTYDASLFILTPREAYAIALAAVNIRTAGKTTEELLELAREHAPYMLGLFESPPRL